MTTYGLDAQFQILSGGLLLESYVDYAIGGGA